MPATVTHIVGFRAFGTQLLCEQVTGRALRRTSYDALRKPDPDGRQRLEAEYADVVGIPFEFMPDVNRPEPAPRPPKPRTQVHTRENKREFRVTWPQVVEYIRVAPQVAFELDPTRVVRWKPPPSSEATVAALEGVAGESQVIGSAPEGTRRRTALLELAATVTAQLATPDALGTKATPGSKNQHNRAAFDDTEVRLGRAFDDTEVRLGRASLFRSALAATQSWVSHPDVALGDLRSLMASVTRRKDAAEAILDACDFHPTGGARRARLATPPLLDTARVNFETTLVNITETIKSELSHAACHSRLELDTAIKLDEHPRVRRWARNFQLGWTIPYWRNGAWARYEPDFVAVLDNGANLVIECKAAWDDKAREAADYTTKHWIPSIAGTTDLPDDLRRWGYAVIDDPDSIRHQLDLAIAETSEREPSP